ncbi:TniQ family protein [Dactylosporangium sp. CA-139066]|uniref:TniQ family protein n=1 Tax=Dactylosporangium sp. CA-139066 TaxID=3239930 RepID=UPI003D93D86A
MSVGLPRRLGLVLAPEVGESLASWIDRLGQDMRRSPGLVADDLGLRVVPGAVQRPLSLLFGITANDEQTAAVEAATGVGAEVLHAMHLSAYDGTVLDLSDLADDKASVQRVWFREWALFTTSRACPSCLAESGGVWMLWWRLAAAAVCPTHRLMLVSHCPRCGLELRRGTERNQGVPPRTLLVEPTRCANRTRDRMCGYPLTELPQVPVHDDVCAAQLAFLDAAYGRPPPVAGRCIGAAEWAWAFRSICGLVRFVGDSIELPAVVPAAAAQALVDDARRRRGAASSRQVPGYRSKPRSALLATALLAFAGRTLAAGNDDDLIEAMRPFGAAVVEGPGAQECRPLWRWRMPPLVSMAVRAVFPTPMARWSRAGAHVPFAADVDRSASRTPRRRRTSAASSRSDPGGCLEFRHLPRLVAEADYQELIEPWLRTPPGLSGRRYVALALARICGARTWARAGLALGWPDGRAAAVADYVCEFVVDPARFWQAATTLADRLQERGPIDYDHRRQALSRFVTIDRGIWGPLFAEHGGRLMPAGCRAAAVWLWTAMTCGELGDAPALLDPGWSTVPIKSRLRTCRTMSRWLPDALADQMLRFGATLLDSHNPR